MTLKKKPVKKLISFEITEDNDEKLNKLKKVFGLSKTVILNEIIKDYKTK